MSLAQLILRALSAPLVPRRRGQDGAPAHAIVVLGAPLREDGELTVVGAERVREGVQLWREGRAPVLCMTGGISRCPHTAEADAMARLARSLGVPADRLIVERESKTTAQNASMSAKLLLSQGKTRVWLVSQPFHLRRACLWFRRAGFQPMPWCMKDSVQFQEPLRGLRWVMKEYPALLRDWVQVTRM